METFLASIGWVVVRLLKRHGVDAHMLFREAGVDLTALRDPAARIPFHVVDAVTMQAAKLIDDPAFALHTARCWHPSDLGVLGYAWLSSSTLRTGLQRMARYRRTLGDRATLKIRDTRAGTWVVHDPRRRDPIVAGIGSDFVMSMIMDMCRMNYGGSLRPVEVRLVRAKPSSTQPYRKFYGCPIQFGAREDSFLLSGSVVNAALPTSNRQLAATLDQILTRQLAALDKTNIAARCKATLLEQLTSGAVSAQEMAQQLHMSHRTLQRRLAEQATSYQALVDATRHDLALRYMEDPNRSVTEVTFLLGFSGQSAFTRAFKRWTGVSPTTYRAQNASSAAS
jgi:AraC-like DNA-binding protein